MRVPITLIAVGTSLLASSDSRGRDLIQMDFDGVVTLAGLTSGVNLELGDPLHARVVFDTDAVDYEPSPLVGRYEYEFMEVFSNRGLVFRSGPSPPGSVAALVIYRGVDEFQFRGFVGLHDNSIVSVRFPTGTFGDDRPPTSLPFATATEANYTFYFISSPISRAALTAYSAAVVPEPATGAVVLCMLGLLIRVAGETPRARSSRRR